MIQEIVDRLDAISSNVNNEPLYILGGYIVGTTIVRDDIDELYEKYPKLEYIAELGAELETLEETEFAEPIFKRFQIALKQFKETLKKQ